MVPRYIAAGAVGGMFAKITWWRFLAGAAAWAAFLYAAIVVSLFFLDPYGRSGIRPSDKIANLPERLLMVSRAMDPAFDSAVVGNSTSIPIEPGTLNKLTGLRFVSLSMSGSQSPAAITAARFFLQHHSTARAVVVAMDNSWCTRGHDVDETHPFPFWLYGSNAAYFVGLVQNASTAMFATSAADPGNNRLDGYHPYDEAIRKALGSDPDRIRDRLDKLSRPTQALYATNLTFGPPIALSVMVGESNYSVHFVLLWTPRYKTLIPKPDTPAAAADSACKLQVANEFSQRKNVKIIDWSGDDRPENLDSSNFYETNHYRDSIARLLNRDIASALQNIGE
jgi:hypothetical protein